MATKSDDLGNDWVRCDECQDWILYENTKMKAALAEIERRKEKFTCRVCRAEERIGKLEAECKKLGTLANATKRTVESGSQQWADVVKQAQEARECGEKANDAEKKVAELRSDLTKVEEMTREANRRTTDLTTAQLKQAADEMSDIDKRKLNLIVSGFSEYDDDLRDFLMYANSCHNLPDAIEPSDIVSMERLGRPPGLGRPRLLRIKFSSAAKRRTVLTMKDRMLDKFNNPRFHTYIRPDLTRAQQIHDKELRQELMSEGKGRERYMIHRGRVVLRERGERDDREGTASGGHGENAAADVKPKRPATATTGLTAPPGPSTAGTASTSVSHSVLIVAAPPAPLADGNNAPAAAAPLAPPNALPPVTGNAFSQAQSNAASSDPSTATSRALTTTASLARPTSKPSVPSTPTAQGLSTATSPVPVPTNATPPTTHATSSAALLAPPTVIPPAPFTDASPASSTATPSAQPTMAPTLSSATSPAASASAASPTSPTDKTPGSIKASQGAGGKVFTSARMKKRSPALPAARKSDPVTPGSKSKQVVAKKTTRAMTKSDTRKGGTKDESGQSPSQCI